MLKIDNAKIGDVDSNSNIRYATDDTFWDDW